MRLFRVDRGGSMFLFCSHGVNPSFQAALDPDPGEFRVLHRPGRRRRDGGLAVLPNFAFRMVSSPMTESKSLRSRPIASPTRIPVTASKAINVRNVATRCGVRSVPAAARRAGDRGTNSKPIPGPHLVYGFLATAPNAVAKPIHPKAMPVILTTEEERDVWMRG